MGMGKRTGFWIILFAALLLMGAAGLFAATKFAAPGLRAVIRLDGEIYEEIDLTAVTVPYEIRIETELGENTIRVEHGRIGVTAADCPDQVCVHQGMVETAGVPVVCLPHRLTIQLEAEP